MFTGQGSQWKGMWEGLDGSPAARSIFQMTEEVTEYSLYTDDLKDTSKAQPAIVAHSLAALAAAKEICPEIFTNPPAFCLGHSVGEYPALVAAGVIDAEPAINLVMKRGLLMELAGWLNPGKMAALLGFEDQKQVSAICQKSGAEIANFNCPGQIVISGRAGNITDAVKLAKEEKIRVVELDISVASHSSLMRLAQGVFAEVLAPVRFKKPKIPVISNVTARPYKSGAEIKKLLAEQLTSSVQWQKSIEYALDQGVTTFIEFGPRPVLTELLKRISREARGFCVSDLASVQALCRTFPN